MDGNQTPLHQALKELHARATGGETEVDVPFVYTPMAWLH